MGALLSLPVLALPGIGTVISFAASCCGAATCSMLCSALGRCQNSVMTRIGYSIILLINSLLSWLMLTDWAFKKLEHLVMDYMSITCNGKECYGFVAVHRINFALGTFHAIMALLLLAAQSSKKAQRSLQNGYWGPKLFAWISFIVISFLIPDTFFIFWGNYLAHAGAIVFLLIGLVLLIDLAHSWAEYCLDKYHEGSDNWRYVLVFGSLGMYLASIAMTIVMYIFFGRSNCSMNQAVITINLILMVGVSYLSVALRTQNNRRSAGLGPASLVSLYCTYLIMSAVAMEPDDKHCNPLVRANGTRTASIVLGAVMTFVTMAYSTTRAATTFFSVNPPPKRLALPESESAHLQNLSQNGYTSVPSDTLRTLRPDALAAAIEAGSLPAGTVDSDIDDDDSSSGDADSVNDEKRAVKYNYVVFHLIFMISTAWVATLLTMNVNPQEHEGEFIAVGRTYWASWVKIVSSWVCYGIYSWTLVAPVLMPDRFDFDD